MTLLSNMAIANEKQRTTERQSLYNEWSLYFLIGVCVYLGGITGVILLTKV
jgi:hypothetical protein